MTSANQVAIVTGASRGLGRCHALALAERGYRIGLITRHGSRAVAAEIEHRGHEALDISADVRVPEQVESAVSAVRARWGRIDVQLNNAGVMLGDVDFIDLTVEQWREILDTNLTGAFLCARAVIPTMIEQGSGVIVNVTSGAAVRTGFLNVPYGVSKAALDRLTMGLGAELEQYGIACLSLSPPATATDTVRAMYPDRDVDAWASPPEMTARALCELLRDNPMRYTGTVVSVRDFLESQGKLG